MKSSKNLKKSQKTLKSSKKQYNSNYFSGSIEDLVKINKKHMFKGVTKCLFCGKKLYFRKAMLLCPKLRHFCGKYCFEDSLSTIQVEINLYGDLVSYETGDFSYEALMKD